MSLTQPTVSDHIISFEVELGCRLFDRMGRTIMPTKEAESLYPHAVELIERTDAVREIIGQVRNNPSGELIAGASTTPGSFLLPYMMASFRSKYPDIVFQIITGDSKYIIGKLHSHELLLGIVGCMIPDDRLSYTRLCEDELILISSPDFIKKNCLRLEEIREIPFILREEGSGTRLEIENILFAKDIDINTLKTVGIFGTTTGIMRAVKAGMGLSIVSRIAAREYLKNRELKEIKMPDLPMRRNIYMVIHKKRTLPSAYRLFIEHMTQEIKKQNALKAGQGRQKAPC